MRRRLLILPMPLQNVGYELSHPLRKKIRAEVARRPLLLPSYKVCFRVNIVIKCTIPFQFYNSFL